MIGWSKAFGSTVDEVLYDMSYRNLIMYSAATPQFDDVVNEWDESLDANDPNNCDGADELFV